MAPTIPRESSEPFPAKQLIVLGLCRLAEPIAFLSIISYNFAMVSEIKGPDNASFWAGMLVSAFAIAEASTAVIWGAISDRIGRKPVILIGLTGTTISCLVLGFARNYWIALVARVIGGLLNGNLGVMQTMVAEIVKDPKHEPRAYSIQPLAWSIGSIAGSALGGYAAQPARFYPDIFSADGIFAKYPYLLPNLVAAGCIGLAILITAILLEETNPAVLKQRRPVSTPQTAEVNERTPLRPHRRSSVADAFSSGPRRPSYVAGSAPTFNEPGFDIRKKSFASVNSFSAFTDPVSEESAIEDDDDDDSQQSENSLDNNKTFNRSVILYIGAIALMAYHHMGFISVFSTFILDEPQVDHGLDLRGGLGLTVHDMGQFMAINSGLSLIVQIFILPVFMTKVGLWRSVVILTSFVPLIDIAMPFITAFSTPKYAVYPTFFLLAFCNIIIYPCLLIMLKNSAPSKKSLGRINGLAVSASSAARTIAPPLIGVFYSGLGSAGAWWSCAVFGLMAASELFFFPRDVTVQRSGEGESG